MRTGSKLLVQPKIVSLAASESESEIEDYDEPAKIMEYKPLRTSTQTQRLLD